MKIIQRFDAMLGIDDFTWYHVDASTRGLTDVLETWKWWQGMVGEEFHPDCKVTLNVDNIETPSVYFLTIYTPDEGKPYSTYPTYSTDLFFVIGDDDPEVDDVSMLNGAQCRDCGRVNVEADEPSLIAPVWRQARDGAHLLCDDCADKEA